MHLLLNRYAGHLIYVFVNFHTFSVIHITCISMKYVGHRRRVSLDLCLALVARQGATGEMRHRVAIYSLFNRDSDLKPFY